MKKKLLLSLFLLPLLGITQQLHIAGTLLDTVAKKSVPYAVVMAIKLSDSTLVNFTRTNDNGLFQLEALPVDTYQVLITHPQFADQGFFIFGDHQNLNYNFGKIITQPKNLNLEEVTIFAFKDPVYYKGDTLIYTADSFKVRANANVEDLLKKLPGMKVDADGKITTQGKKVDKVLVDGDEFFGGDPTIATKNLAANSIESIQVYDKKSDDVSNSATGEETQKILNLKLKEDSKKGYFGKVSGASDFRKFYESEALANYFKKQLKVSVFALATNTPKSGFGWGDMFKYGLSNEYQRNETDDGDMSFNGNNNQAQGIPQNLKTGFYFSNKFSAKTKLNVNYTYNTSTLNSGSTTNSQYFLNDTNYTTNNQTHSLKKNEAHALNFLLEQKIDSLTEFTLKSGVKLLSDNTTASNQTEFVGSDAIKTRNTTISNNAQNSGYDLSNSLKLKRKFKKKDRLLTLTYSNAVSNSTGNGLLETENKFYVPTTLTLTAINQKKDVFSNNVNHNLGTVFTEPFGKKIKLETSYDWMYYNSAQNKQSFNNINGEYNALDSNYTNDFTNTKQINRGGLKFIYEVKKVRFTLGSKVRNVVVHNRNLFLNTELNQNFNNVLPFSSVRFKPKENMAFDLVYTLQSSNPTITQLQPIKDNSNPNFINIGNPNLLPTQEHQIRFNYNSWKSISGKYYWAGGNYSFINNDFSSATNYDNIGRTVTQTINLNGNYSYDGYVGFYVPVFSKKINLESSLSAGYNSNKNYINNQLNITRNLNTMSAIKTTLNLDSLIFSLEVTFDYFSPSSTLNTLSSKPYNKQTYTATSNVKLPLRLTVASDIAYTINSKRANGYNVNYTVWNASLSRTFLKTENLMIGFHAYDMLNQNINVVRNITSNVISDVKTNIISRYFLLKATLKFNNNKTKETDDGM